MKNAKVILNVLIINTLILSLLIILLEIFLGSWFKDNSWGNTLRSERLKEQNYKIKFNDQTMILFTKEIITVSEVKKYRLKI